MGVGFKIDWNGLERLTVTLKRSSSRTETLAGQVVRNNTEKVKTIGQTKAPVDTKFLKGQIKSSYPSKLEGRVKSAAFYAGYQEYGTRFQPGTPHIRPAIQEVEPQFKKDLTDVMNEVFE